MHGLKWRLPRANFGAPLPRPHDNSVSAVARPADWVVGAAASVPATSLASIALLPTATVLCRISTITAQCDSAKAQKFTSLEWSVPQRTDDPVIADLEDDLGASRRARGIRPLTLGSAAEIGRNQAKPIASCSLLDATAVVHSDSFEVRARGPGDQSIFCDRYRLRLHGSDGRGLIGWSHLGK
jgi:hypothetical protein